MYKKHTKSVSPERTFAASTPTQVLDRRGVKDAVVKRFESQPPSSENVFRTKLLVSGVF